tara:strand:+ start:130 stop:861 length:732 start_codon:yes stop_codon:yes gene_type:complete
MSLPFNPNNPDLLHFNDSFMDLINQLKEWDIPKFTFVKSVKLNDISSLSVRDAKQFIENEGCVKFELEHNRIKKERDKLISRCNSFYTQYNPKYCNDGKINTTLQEMIYELNQWEIRLKRMLCILNPKFNVTDGFNKTTNKSYRLLKGYWINDQNQKKRIFNKNVGISDASIEYHFERFFKNRGYDVTIYLKLLNGFITDLVIEKDGVQEAVEFKLSNRNKDEFYNQFMSLEMWFKYKDIYVN